MKEARGKFRSFGLYGCGLMVGAYSLLGIAPAMAERNIADIQRCMRGNFVDRGTLRDFRIETTDDSGHTEVITAKLYWLPTREGHERINMRVASPSSLAGSAFLLRGSNDGDDVQMYLPAMKSVRRITGQDRSQPLWGTDFSVADVKQLQGLLADGETSREDDDDVDGRKTYVLTTIPEAGTSRFGKITSYVDQQSCMLLRSVFFESKGHAGKILTADTSSLVSEQVYDRTVWMLFAYTMRDLQRNSRSVLSMGGIDLMFKELPARAFEPEHFFKDFN